jgi:hypothetical protein
VKRIAPFACVPMPHPNARLSRSAQSSSSGDPGRVGCPHGVRWLGEDGRAGESGGKHLEREGFHRGSRANPPGKVRGATLRRTRRTPRRAGARAERDPAACAGAGGGGGRGLRSATSRGVFRPGLRGSRTRGFRGPGAGVADLRANDRARRAHPDDPGGCVPAACDQRGRGDPGAGRGRRQPRVRGVVAGAGRPQRGLGATVECRLSRLRGSDDRLSADLGDDGALRRSPRSSPFSAWRRRWASWSGRTPSFPLRSRSC